MFEFDEKSALLIVDVQNDFLPGGALPIENGHDIIPHINNYIIDAIKANVPIYYSLDYHPENHMSFVEYGGIWARHCVKNTHGVELAQELKTPFDSQAFDNRCFVYKGQEYDKEQYSAFDGTSLHYLLSYDNIEKLLITGLAFDVCVLETIKSAYGLMYDIYVDLNTTKAVTEEGHEKTVDYLMKNEMVTFV
jgi:nicotinamidase/pyrazinamidase